MKPFFLFSLILLSITIKAQEAGKFNLNFETCKPGAALPEGWFPWGNYALGIDSAITHSGKYAARIASSVVGNAFGSIAYSFPANYKGKSIKLEGFMKTEDVANGFAGLLLRIDGNGASLGFDNMETQNIHGTNDWKKYTITLPYPEEGERIFVGGILVGAGQAWFDDLVLTIDGTPIQDMKERMQPVFKASADKAFDTGSGIKFPELNKTQLANLELLGRVWGFLKYNHPEVGKGNYNWDYELFRVLPEYLATTDAAKRDQILLSWMEKYGKIAPCKACKKTPEGAFLKPDLAWIANSNLSSKLVKKLNEVYENRYQGKHFYIRMTPGIGNPEFLHENPYAEMSYPDEGFRLLALYRYWNMIQYFFPYKHLTDKNWNVVLGEYLPKFIQAKNELEYEQVATQLIGEVHDSHATLGEGSDKIQDGRGSFYPPFHVQFIENKLVVTDYYNPELQPTAELRIGDIITHINNIPVERLVDSLRNYYPASNDAARLRNMSTDLLRSTTSTKSIQYLSDGQKKEKVLPLYTDDNIRRYMWYRKSTDKCYKMLAGNIGYITLKSIKAEDIEPIQESFKDTKGIIIDIRNYPSYFVPFALGSFFVSSSTPFVKFTGGNVDNPGEFTFIETLEVPKSRHPYTGKLVVIVNELSQSQAEYTTMAFRAGSNTTILGSTTAGADGNVSGLYLPGGLHTMISGIGVYYPDGKETQRVGIVPDVVVRPTIEGIKAGRDELLEKAIEVIGQ